MFEYIINKKYKLDFNQNNIYLYTGAAFDEPKKRAPRLSVKNSKEDVPKPFRIKKRTSETSQQGLSVHTAKNINYIKELEKKNAKENEKPNIVVKVKQLSQKNVEDLVSRLAAKPNKINTEESLNVVARPLRSIRAINDENYQNLMKKRMNQTFNCTTRSEYCKMNKLSVETVLFYFNSGDKHILSYLKSLKFAQITNPSCISFADIIYEFNDSSQIYRNLQPTSVYNHFKGNRQLTCKNKLTENLQRRLISNKKRFYPLTFDFGVADHQEAFKEEYFKIQTFKVLKKHIAYFKRNAQKTMKIIKEGLNSSKQRSNQEFEYFYGSFTTRSKKLIATKRPDFIVSLLNIQQLLDYWKSLKSNQSSIEDDFKITNHKKFSSESRSAIKKLAVIKEDYDKWPLELLEEVGVSEEYWKTPNFYLMYKMYKLHRFFKANSPTYSKNCDLNIWIVKPSSKSKGCGIALSDSKPEVLDICKDSDRIVQKYIERPLTIENSLKFDIRLWVLVTSVKPLIIHYFKDFYIRVCPSEYDNYKLNKIDSHLTNYSLNKDAFSCKNESVRSRAYLVNYLRRTHKVDFDSKIMPRIEKLIVETITTTADSFEHRPNSFELLGFDVLIDQDFKPWLLEVNLSPACDVRADFLKNSVAEMTKFLFNIVYPQLLNKSNDQPNPKDDEQHQSTSITDQFLIQEEGCRNSWQLIWQDTQTSIETPSCYTTFELSGKKLNIDLELSYTRQVKEEYSAKIITRFFKRIVRYKNEKAS